MRVHEYHRVRETLSAGCPEHRDFGIKELTDGLPQYLPEVWSVDPQLIVAYHHNLVLHAILPSIIE